MKFLQHLSRCSATTSMPSARSGGKMEWISSTSKFAYAFVALAMLLLPSLGMAQTMTSVVFNPANPCQNPAPPGGWAISNVAMNLPQGDPALNGTEYRYAIDVTAPTVGTAAPNVFVTSGIQNIPAGPHCLIAVTVTTAANVTYGGVTYPTSGTVVAVDEDCFYLGQAGPPGNIDITGFNGSCATTVTPPATPALPGCFTYQYSVDNGPWTDQGTAIAVAPGCHVIQRRVRCNIAQGVNPGPFGCLTLVNGVWVSAASDPVPFVIFNDLSALAATALSVSTTCAAYPAPGNNGTVTAVNGLPMAPVGLTYQYSIDNGANWGTLPITGLTPGCKTISIRQVSDCPPNGAGGADLTSTNACQTTRSFVIFPSMTIPAPVVAENGQCTATTVNITTPNNLPALPAGFQYFYSVDGGAFAATIPAQGVGCHNLVAKVVTSAACGNTPAGTDGDDSGAGYVAPNPTCLAASPATNFTIHPNLSGYTNTLTPASACVAGLATTTVTFSPALPTLPAGFQYVYALDVADNPGNTFSTTIPAVGAGCHTITVATVCIAAGNGPFAQNASALSNLSCRYTANVVIFPTLAGAALTGVNLDQTCGPTTVLSVTGNAAYNLIVAAAGLVGFQAVYQLDGTGPWVAFQPNNGTVLQPGCHTIRVKLEFIGNNAVCADAQAPNDCATPAFNFAVFPDISAIAPASVAITTTCDNPTVAGGDGSVTVNPAAITAAAFPNGLPNGWSYQYAFDDNTFGASNTENGLTAGCHYVRIRMVSNCGGVVEEMAAACRLNIGFVIFPDASDLDITAVNLNQACNPANVTSLTFVPVAPVIPNFTLQYSLDGGAYSTVLPTGVAAGCHTIRARYAFTGTPCAFNLLTNPSTGLAGPIPATQFNNVTTPPDACVEEEQFVVWPDIDGSTPVVSLQSTCGAQNFISNVTLSPNVTMPTGFAVQYRYGVNNAVANQGPVDLAGLQAVNFGVGCHRIQAVVVATTACGTVTAGTAGPACAATPTVEFVTFPAPPALTVPAVCEDNDIVAVPNPLLPPGGFGNYEWRFRLVNTVTNTASAWQILPVFANQAPGCYRVEVVPVRDATCGNILLPGGAIMFPSDIQLPLDNQTPADINAVPATFPAACVNGVNTFILPAAAMAITPNNITVCENESGRIDLQPALHLIPACLLPPADPSVFQVAYSVSSSDDNVVASTPALGGACTTAGLLLETGLPFPNATPEDELVWTGTMANGTSVPKVVTIGITPRFWFDADGAGPIAPVCCDGPEVKFSITVNPRLQTPAFQYTPTSSMLCSVNDGWTISSVNAGVAQPVPVYQIPPFVPGGPIAGCYYELYYGATAANLPYPANNALIQTIQAVQGQVVTFQKVYVPGTYEVWQRCDDGCYSKVHTVNVSIDAAPTLIDQTVMTCADAQGGNSGTFTIPAYVVTTNPAATTPLTVAQAAAGTLVQIKGYYQTATGALNGTAGDLIPGSTAAGNFPYTSVDGDIYIRIGQDGNNDGDTDDAGIDCYFVVEVELQVKNRPVVTITATPNPLCTNGTVNLTANVSSGSGSVYTYAWSANTAGGTNSTTTASSAVAGPVVYSVTVTDPNTNVGGNGSTFPCTSVASVTVNYVGPTFANCPVNITESSASGECRQYINFDFPILSMPCTNSAAYEVRYYTTGATVIGTALAPVAHNVVSGVWYNVGVTTVTGVIYNVNTNLPEPNAPNCVFTITVNDNAEPLALCRDLTVFLDNVNMTSVNVTAAMADAGSVDNCNIATRVLAKTTFTCADLGQNLVNLTVTDVNNNTATCTSTITVLDVKAPTFTCPAPITISGCSSTVPDVLAGINNEADNCTAAGSLVLTQTPAAGGAFGIGTSTILVEVADASGNVAFCNVPVTVTTKYTLNLDVPEVCLTAAPSQLSFANYLTIVNNNTGAVVSQPLSNPPFTQIFSIASSNVSGGTAGSINAATGVYTPGTGSGFVTIRYELTETQNGTPCTIFVEDVFELRQPLTMSNTNCACNNGEREVNLSNIGGGLAPYTLIVTGATLVGGYNGTAATATIRLNQGETSWGVTLRDSRGCEYALAGTCAEFTEPPVFQNVQNAVCASDPDFVINVGRPTAPGNQQYTPVSGFFQVSGPANAAGIDQMFGAGAAAGTLAGSAITVNPTPAITTTNWTGVFTITFTYGQTGDAADNCQVQTISQQFTIYPSYNACFTLPAPVLANGEVCKTAPAFVIANDPLFNTNRLFGQTVQQTSIWSMTTGNGTIYSTAPGGTPGPFTLDNNTGSVTFNPNFAGLEPGTYTINHILGVDACQTECSATITIKPTVDATIQNRTFCASLSGNVPLSSMFVPNVTTGNGVYAITQVRSAGPNNVFGDGDDVIEVGNIGADGIWGTADDKKSFLSGDVVLLGNGIVQYDENGQLDYVISVLYAAGNPACSVTPLATDLNDCYMQGNAQLTITNGHSAFLDLPESIYCTREAAAPMAPIYEEIYKYTSIEDVTLASLTVDGDNNLEPGEIRVLISAVNGFTAEFDNPATPDIDGFRVDVNGDGDYNDPVDIDLRTVVDYSCTGGVDGVPFTGTPIVNSPAMACPRLDLSKANIAKDLNLTVRIEYNDGGCVSLSEDNIWVRAKGVIDFKPTDPVCTTIGTINLVDALFRVPSPMPTTACGTFKINCLGMPVVDPGYTDANNNGVFDSADPNYPKYNLTALIASLPAGFSPEKLYITYTVGDPACGVATADATIDLCNPVVGFGSKVENIACTEGSPINLEKFYNANTTKGGTWYGPFTTLPGGLVAGPVFPPALPAGLGAALNPAQVNPMVGTKFYVYYVAPTCTGCPAMVSIVQITVTTLNPETCQIFGDGLTYDGGVNYNLLPKYCSNNIPTTQQLLRRVCPEIITVGKVSDTECDINTNSVVVTTDGVLSNTQLKVTAAAAGTVYPNATVNDDWFIQLVYFNQTDPSDDYDQTNPGGNLNPGDCVGQAIDDPAGNAQGDLDGGDHAGFAFYGSGLAAADRYVIGGNACPTPATGVTADLFRANDLNGSYNPFTGTPAILAGGSTSCNNPNNPGVGTNDYYIVQFTASDIYAMYDDGNAANGDGKADFLAKFFGNNCNAASEFVWDFGAMTQPEFTDAYMVLGGMKIYNYKENVKAYSNLYSFPAAAPAPNAGPADLGFTIDGTCDGIAQNGTNLPAWLTAKLADVFTVVPSTSTTPDDPTTPSVNESQLCFDVRLDMTQLVQPNCNDVCYNFEIGHTIEKCSGDCGPNADGRFVYTRCVSVDKKPNLVSAEPRTSYYKLGCVDQKPSESIADIVAAYGFTTDICNPSCNPANCPASCSAGCFAAGNLTIPAPFNDYVINDGGKIIVLPTIINALKPGGVNSAALAAYIAAVNGNGTDDDNYPTLNDKKRFYIPFVYTVKSPCQTCPDEKVTRYVYVTRKPEITLPNISPGICPEDVTIIPIGSDCVWPDCVWGINLVNANTSIILANTVNNLNPQMICKLPYGPDVNIAPGVVVSNDCNGDGTTGDACIKIDWDQVPGITEPLTGDFTLNVTVWCGTKEFSCSASASKSYFFLGESVAKLKNATAYCEPTYDLTGLFVNDGTPDGTTTPGGVFQITAGPAAAGPYPIFVSGNEYQFCTAGDYTIKYIVGVTTSCIEEGTAILTKVNPTIAAPAPLTIACTQNNVDNLTEILNWLDNYTITPANCGPAISNVTNDFNPTMINYCTGDDITVTWTATDACGQAITATSTLVVDKDVTAPVFTVPCPNNMVVSNDVDECQASVTWQVPSAVDACSTAGISQISGPSNGSLLPVGTNTVTYRAIDQCGNSATCSFTVTVVDTQAPNAVCQDVVLNLATFTCSSGTLSGAQEVPANNSSATGSFNVVYDAATNRLSLDISWSGLTTPITIAHIHQAAAGSNGPVIVDFSNTIAKATAGSYSTSVILTDAQETALLAGNTYINIHTSTFPGGEIRGQIPAPTTSCTAAYLSAADINGGSTDNCAVVASTLSDATFNCSDLGENNVTLTVFDAAGNTSVCIAEITVLDVTAPVITTCPASVTLNDCDDVVPAFTGLVATDNCTLIPGFTQNPVAGTDFGQFSGNSITVTFTVSDQSGNTQTCTATVTIVDDVKPTFDNCPANITVGNDVDKCGANVTFLNPTAVDNCFDVTVAQTAGLATGALFPVGTTAQAYLATDGAGNTQTCQFTVTVMDMQTPTAVCQDITVDLPASGAVGGEVWINEFHTDNTGTDTGEFIEVAGPAGTDLTQYSLVLYNGNGGAVYSTVVLSGTIANQSNGFGTSVVNYASNGIQNGEPDGIALVKNGTTVVQFLSYEGTFTAVGGPANGMLSTNIGVFETGSEPVGQSLRLSGTGNKYADFVWNSPAAASAGSINQGQTFTAVAGAIQVSVSADMINGGSTDNCPGSLVYTPALTTFTCANVGDNNISLTVTDGAGNKSTCVATVTVRDVTAPTITTCPASVTVNDCDDVVPAFTGLVATDNCSLVPGFTQNPVAGTDFGQVSGNSVTVTFTVADVNGNTSSCTATVTIVDNVNPTFDNCPANITVGNDVDKCGANVTFLNPTASDNCFDATVTQTAGLATGALFPVGTTTQTYLATDGIGNTTTCQFTVTVTDMQAPNAVCNDITVDLSANGTVIVTADDVDGGSNDNCTTDLSLTPASTTFTCANVGDNNITLTVTDAAGNKSTCIATVTVRDVTAPTITTCPASVTVNDCDDVVPAFTGLVATDNCSLVPGFTQNPVAGTDFGQVSGNLVTVTFTVADVNGNTTTCTATVTINDDVAPTFDNCPANITVGNDVDKCGANVTFLNPTASDNCFDATVNQTAGLATGALFPVGTTTQSYLATDGAGNTTTCQFTVTVTDMQAPTAVCQDRTVDLSATINGGTVTVIGTTINGGSTDNCTAAGDLVLTVPNPTYTCANVGDNNVTLVVTDAAGNSSTCVATVTVRDVTAPTFTCPAGVTVDGCNDLVPNVISGLVADDNCGVASITQNPVAGLDFGQVNGNSVDITVTVTDVNGNVATCVVPVTINDDDNPDFLDCPTTMMMFGNDPDQCSAKVNWTPPAAIDECLPLATVVQVAGPLPGSILPITCPATPQTVIYRATDGDGNTSTCSFQVMVVDTEKPEFDADIVMPADVTVECNAVPAPFVLTNNDVNDNCTVPANLVLGFNETSTKGTDPALCSFYDYTITRTWTVTDCAGNTLVHTQIVKVQDTTKPTAVCQNVTLTLDDFGNVTLTPSQLNGGSSDNCAAAANLTFTASKTTFNCSNLGANTVVLTVADPCGNTSTCTAIVTVVEGNGKCTPEYDVDGSDPCVCLNNATTLLNGQFSEIIQIHALAGQNWVVASSNGLFTANSANPPAAPTAITNGTAFVNGLVDGLDNDGDGQIDEANERVYYTLRARHVDAIGYAATFSNGTSTISLSNKCYYPTPVFENLDDPFCLSTPPFTIQVGEENGANGTVTSIQVNGVTTNTFDAAQLGIGFHTVTATFDAGTATPFTVWNGNVINSDAAAQADPGCQQTITQTVQVVGTPTTVVCNDLVSVSLDSTCKATITPDDVLEGSYYCFDDYSVIITYPNGTNTYNPPTMVDATHINKTLSFTLKHAISGNLCWGQIKVEDKLPPRLVCPANITLACSQDQTTQVTGNVAIIDCSPTTTTFIDDVVDNGECGDPRQLITRTFYVTDSRGNQNSCTQVITVSPFNLDNVVFPADITVNCANAKANANATQPGATGRPSINGAPIGAGGLCSASIGYSDEILDVCAGSYEILRTWTVRNTCLPLSATNPIKSTQVIRVNDNQGPQFDCPANVTVSTNPTTCCATSALPSIIVSEACSDIVDLDARVTGVDPNTGNVTTFTVNGSLADFAGNNYWNPDTLAVFGFTNCMVLGDYNVEYTAEDECGNVSTCAFTLTVADLVPPVAACDQLTQVGLGISGMAFVDALTFDDGSYDNCSDVHFKVRRMDSNPCQVTNVFHDQVKFCCEDINDTITVILRVYDVPVPAGTVALDAFEGHYNECMVQVLVEDKVKPACTAPANVTVSCENFDPSLWAYGTATYQDNCSLCDTVVTASYTLFDTACNRGTITRTFRITDCGGNFSTCTQRVFVNFEQEYFVRFPDDRLVTFCDSSGVYGEPTFFGEDCELLAVSFTDELYTVVPDACFKIERTWHVINWCVYNPNLGLQYVPNPEPNATVNHPTNLPGVIVSPNGTPSPWNPTVRAITPGAQQTNYSVFYGPNTGNNNGYEYVQIIKIVDLQDPIVTNCPASPVEVCDITDNNAQLWNETYWWDQTIESHDLCEGPSDLSITATDLCSDENITINYLLFLDLDGDGTMETVVNSKQPQNSNEVLFGNGLNANFTGGTPRAFDERAVPFQQKYRFTIQTTVSGDNRTGSVKWNTIQAPNTFVTPELPYGTHKIKWIVEDGCGNETVCEYTFIVKDCKKPTVVCINGLTANLGPTGVCPTMSVNDFLLYATDNCTPDQLIKVGIRKKGTGTGFPVDAQGNPLTTVSYDCSEEGTQFVEIWAIDKAGNADFCETYVIVQDNMGICPSIGDKATVAGVLETEMTDGVASADVNLNGTHPALPPISLFGESTNDGSFLFSKAVPMAADYTVTPEKDDNPLNGVTTFDLVLISRHILGLQLLDSPYKVIAADANKNGTVTSFDIVELRKLILGIYNELPANTSWRFIDAAFNFPNSDNPFASPFPEAKTVANVQTNKLDNDFIGVKIGDVNASAIANDLMTTDDRSAGTLLFDVQDRLVKAGETFEVTLAPVETAQGYQFTLNTKGLEILNVTGIDAENYAVFGDAATFSVDGAAAKASVTLQIRATAAGRVSDLISVSSRITKAEAYNVRNEKLDVAFRYNGKTIAGVGFELYQNIPNPFVNKTQIGFNLPEAGEAILTITDESGRIIFRQEGDYAKGYNTVMIDRAQVTASGVMYYSVQYGKEVATRKMIQAGK